jgi:hypothetical protein
MTTEEDAKRVYEQGVASGAILKGTEIHGQTYRMQNRWRHLVRVKATTLEDAGPQYHTWWELKPDGSMERQQELTWLTGDYIVTSESTYYEYWQGGKRYTQGLSTMKAGQTIPDFALPMYPGTTTVPTWAYEGPARVELLEGVVAKGVPKEALDIYVALGI